MTTASELFENEPIMAILRNMSPEKSVELALRAWDLGIELVEVPIQTPDALPSLEAVCAAAQERGKLVGAGTVVSISQLEASVKAGAAFTVAPGLNDEVVTESGRLLLPHIPGVATATEIQCAVDLGCDWVKAFPATALGSHWFQMMSGPFPNVKFIATGGMDAYSCAEYFDAGVQTVAVGSALADPQQIDLLARVLVDRRRGGDQPN